MTTARSAQRWQRHGQRSRHPRDNLLGPGGLRQGPGPPCSTQTVPARVSVQNPWFVVVGRCPVQLVVFSPSGCASPGCPGPILLQKPRHRLVLTEPWRLGRRGLKKEEDNGAGAADKTRYATGMCSWRRRAEDKCRRSGTATGEQRLKKKRTISERLILVSQRAYWGRWTCGCSRVVRIMMSKGGLARQ